MMRAPKAGLSVMTTSISFGSPALSVIQSPTVILCGIGDFPSSGDVECHKFPYIAFCGFSIISAMLRIVNRNKNKCKEVSNVMDSDGIDKFIQQIFFFVIKR